MDRPFRSNRPVAQSPLLPGEIKHASGRLGRRLPSLAVLGCWRRVSLGGRGALFLLGGAPRTHPLSRPFFRLHLGVPGLHRRPPRGRGCARSDADARLRRPHVLSKPWRRARYFGTPVPRRSRAARRLSGRPAPFLFGLGMQLGGGLRLRDALYRGRRPTTRMLVTLAGLHPRLGLRPPSICRGGMRRPHFPRPCC